jgi:hypothetical protein
MAAMQPEPWFRALITNNQQHNIRLHFRDADTLFHEEKKKVKETDP